MKCPHCGKELAIRKKDSSYGLCHTCKKRYKLPSQQQTYSNIPPKHIREKSERTIRENYRNMLEIEDEEDVSETKDKVILTIMIILFLLIIAVAAYIFLFFK
jgi:transposase-like protein